MSLHLRTVARRTWRSIFRIAILLVITVVMITGMLVGTEGGRITLLKQGFTFSRLWTGLEIEATGIRSPSLMQWEVGQLVIEGLPSTPRIEILNLSLDWRWRFALQNRWWFSQISSTAVNIDMAEPEQSSGENFSSIYDLWPKIPAIRLERLRVDALNLHRPRYPKLETSVDAQIEINWGALPARFVFALNHKNNQYALQLSADAIDQVRLQGAMYAEPNTAWASWMKWQMDEPAEATWDINIDYSQSGFLTVDIAEWTLPWKNDLLEAQGSLFYDIDNIEIEFNPLSLQLNNQPAELSGWLGATESELSVSVDQWAIDPFMELFGQSDFSGAVSIDANWMGGWRQPRLDGDAGFSGTWRDHPLTLVMNSVAELSSLFITEAQVTLANNAVSLQGRIDWITDEVDFIVEGDLQTDPLLRDFLPPALKDFESAVNISGNIAGPVNDPSLSLAIRSEGRWLDDEVKLVSDAAWHDGELKLDNTYLYTPIVQLQGSAEWRLSDALWQSEWQVSELRTDSLSRLNLTFPVSFDAAAYGNLQVSGTGLDFAAQGNLDVTGRWQNWPMQANLVFDSLDKNQVTFGESRLQLGTSQTTALGQVLWAEQFLDLRFEHQEWPLATLPPWLKFWPGLMSTLDGDWTGRTSLLGKWYQPQISTDSQLIGSWFNEPLNLSIQTRPQSATEWDIPSLTAEWLGARWQYSGDFRPFELWLDGNAKIEALHVSQIPLLSREFTGAEKRLPERMDLTLSGDLRLREKLTSPVLNGTAKLTGAVDQLPFVMDLQLGYLDTSYVDIAEANGQWAGGTWQFDGLYDWRLQQMAMSFETDSPKASHLVPWVQGAMSNDPQFNWLEQWDGSLVGRFQLDNRTADWLIDADLSSEGFLFDEQYKVRWVGDGRLRQALEHRLEASWSGTTANANLKSDSEVVQGTIDVETFEFDKMRRILPAIPDWLSGIANANLTIEGPWSNPQYQAQISSVGQITLSQILPYNAYGKLQGSKNSWQLSQTVLEIPDGLLLTVDGQGEGLQGEVLLEGVLPDTQYWISNAEIGPGEAVFSTVLRGNLRKPTMLGDFEWQSDSWPLRLTGQLQTDESYYRLQTALYSDGVARLKGDAILPLLPLAQWQQNWATLPMQITGVVNSPMSVLDPFFVDSPDLLLAGNVSGQLQLNGSFVAPSWQGQLNWQQGQFEHAGYGALIDDIELSIKGNGPQWQIAAQGNDGRRGIVSAAGFIDFIEKPEQLLGHSIQLAVGFGGAQILNRAQMEASVNGAVRLVGAYHNLELLGDLVVTPLTMQTDSFLWDGAPQLNIVKEQASQSAAIVERPDYWPRGTWDVNLYANNRANLYGQGISAELSGDLVVTDDLYEPVIAGQFSLVRGTYTGLGRVFQLNSGSVLIQNNQMVLDIQGEHLAQMQINGQRQLLPIALRITGTRDALNLTLSSDANLDQDELLAQLLFGKIVDELDVFQAVQLANVINKLRTGNSGFDIVGATRDSFALDALVVDTESNEEGELNFNISAGKYLNDFLYLEVEQDVGSEQEFRGSIQYQVTPNTNLEVYTQGQGGAFEDNGIEFNWSWDY